MLKDISHGKIVQIELKNPTKPLNYSDVRLYLAIKNDIIVSLGELDGTLFKPIKVLV